MLFSSMTFIYVFLPILVLLYLVTSNVIQIVQTVIVNKQIDLEYAQTGNVTDIDISNAKKIEPKE